jgi:hypothetical protein
MRLVAGLFALTLSSSLAFAEEAKTPEPQAVLPPISSSIRLVKILPDSHQALLYDKQRSTHVLVNEGSTIGDLEVQTIEKDAVTLAAEGLEVVLAAPEGWRSKGRGEAPAKPVAVVDEPAVEKVTTAKPVAKRPAPVEAPAIDDEADLPEKDPYFVVEPPTLTPYDEVEGEEDHPADPYSVPEGTATVTASATPANPYEEAAPPIAKTKPARPAVPPYEEAEDAPYDEVAEIQDDDQAEPAVVATTVPTTVIARRDLDAALADFGTLTRSLRGSFQPNGAKLEQVARGSVFAKAGLRVGDVVTSVDGRPVRTIDDAAELYVRAQTTRATNVQILRAGKPLTLKVQIR